MSTNRTPEILTEFEAVTCSRCGGTGKYSFCLMYGDTCFKCKGTGKIYTARGLAARLYFDNLGKVMIESLAIGDVVWADPVGYIQVGGWGTVTAIDVPGQHVITTRGDAFGAMIRKARTAEQKAADKAEALEYQATLTKAGKPRRR